MKQASLLAALVAIFAMACSKSDGRSTTPTGVVDRAVHDVETSVEESPDRVEQAADDVGDSVKESPDRVEQTADEVGETVEGETD
jgi:hypothetical protein